MKRKNNIYQDIISVKNLALADQFARKGKAHQRGVIDFDLTRDVYLMELHDVLKNKLYRTSEYYVFPIYEPKERLVFRLPYYPDRIVHWAVMLHLEKLFVDTFTADTYSCIKKKGIHAATYAVRKALLDIPGTRFCLKLDVRKFYPNVKHDILKMLLRKKIKDRDLLWLLDEIIDSADGLPIGNYLSQYLANFYMTYFDHWIKEVKKEKYYFRYADDIVILHSDKKHLHELLADIRSYLHTELQLEIKGNYQVFPVKSRGIDFVGYPTYHNRVRIRKSIKRNIFRKIKKERNPASLASYLGWLKHANCKNLERKIMYEYNKTI